MTTPLQITSATPVYVLSDSLGETGELVVKAASSQFEQLSFAIHRLSYIQSTQQITEALQKAQQENGIVIYTLVKPDLKNHLESMAASLDLPCLDLLGPVLSLFSETTHCQPKLEPGLIRKMDASYYSKMEAIEYAVRFDDGKEFHGLNEADMVIIGVSRCSKTPLCTYLAYQGIKAANVPLVPETPIPEDLFQIDRSKIFGLTIKPELLCEIRKNRMSHLGMVQSTRYANLERVQKELAFAHSIMKKLGCPIIDVTHRGVEEIASNILALYEDQARQA